MDCEGVVLDVRGLPEGVTVVLFDDYGQILGRASREGGTASLRLEHTRNGARHFFVVVNSDDSIYDRAVRFEAEISVLR